jgi:hypothetical protein
MLLDGLGEQFSKYFGTSCSRKMEPSRIDMACIPYDVP